MPSTVQPITRRSAVQQCLRARFLALSSGTCITPAEVLPQWQTWIPEMLIVVLIKIVS